MKKLLVVMIVVLGLAGCCTCKTPQPEFSSTPYVDVINPEHYCDVWYVSKHTGITEHFGVHYTKCDDAYFYAHELLGLYASSAWITVKTETSPGVESIRVIPVTE